MKAISVCSDRVALSTWGNIQTQLDPAQHIADLLGTILSNPKLGKIIIDRILDGTTITSPQALLDLIRLALTTNADYLSLTKIQYAKIQAALELGKQIAFPLASHDDVAITDPEQAAAILAPAIGYESIETFAILILNIKHHLIGKKIISKGTATETLAHPREIFRAVIAAGGIRCIVAHNHPSGSLEPSIEDFQLTRQLLQASEILNIPLLDHLILSRDSFISLRETTDLWCDREAL